MSRGPCFRARVVCPPSTAALIEPLAGRRPGRFFWVSHSPVVFGRDYQRRLYDVKHGGLLSCVNATNGAWIYRGGQMGAAGDYYASPVAGRDKICLISRRGMALVVTGGGSYQVLARNDPREPVMATPALVDNLMYVRMRTALHAVGQKL
jgi:hypothetical protein